ncbi:protein-glutamate methylesterase [Marinicella pacifica]|jgi:chemotaxis response regulator CheB|uniref:protein-glutamate methylesterase n=1 Tax=Marinicella pacifica TaxID=1171543 RepID=A0A917CEW5_9GAMM|nr:chemotaxis protein CheB [Marinicella pacifica]GGF85641.1 protein-glutamate methylesterase [Marinicella pacifica]
MSEVKTIGLIHVGKPQPSAVYLADQLKAHDYKVVTLDADDFSMDSQLDAYVINLIDDDYNIEPLVHELTDAGAKIVFNDTQVSNDLVGWNKNRWLRHLLHKINPKHDLLPIVSHPGRQDKLKLKSLGIEQVWILAASIGGPEAIVRFLAEFEGDEPILFVVVQHMDSEFVGMMAKQLNKNQKIPVSLATSGLNIKPGSALLIPVDESIVFQSDGRLAVKDVNPHRTATPCIDDVCGDLINQLKSVNLAVFSGMASDGVVGATNVFDNGGTIITQSAESSVVSSISDEVRALKMSRFDGIPKEMAQFIKERLNR